MELKGEELFYTQVHLHGGPAPVRAYLPDLIERICSGSMNPGRVFDLTLPLDQVADAYRAMDERRAIKVLLQPQPEGDSLMNIQRAGSRPSTPGNKDYFTGTVRIDPMFQAEDPARVGGASVTFEPGARTAWHTHPLGQTLIITSGSGRVQRWGGPIEEVRPGDVVWFPPGEKHWHGASPTTAMSHLAIQESVNGTAVEWLEHVTDDQYLG